MHTSLNPQQRLKYHNEGRVKSTRYRRPLELAYYEEIATHRDARKREWHPKHPAGYLEKKQITAKLFYQLISSGGP